MKRARAWTRSRLGQLNDTIRQYFHSFIDMEKKKMAFRLCFVLTAIFILISNSILAAPIIHLPATENFITIADIHFDPFYDCNNKPRPCALLQKLQVADAKEWDAILASHPTKIASYQEDTNYPLLQSTLMELKQVKQNAKPQFVLVLGDFLAHKFNEKYKKYSGGKSLTGYAQFVNKTMQYLAYKLNQTFPDISVFPVVGNNDSYTGDYNVVPHGAFLSDTAKSWAPLIKDKNNQQAFQQSFPELGAYTILLPHHQKIIILNTVLFSSNSNKKTIQLAANKQLNWLKLQLATAQQEHANVILAFHIPMGVDVYTSIKFFFLSIKEFWEPVYSSEFEQILQHYGTTIVAILPAHIHMDAYQYISTNDIPVIFTSSVSPIFGNNPGFKVFTYDPMTLNISNFMTYYYPDAGSGLASWQLEYSFNQVYQPKCQHCAIIDGMMKIKIDNTLADYYQKYYAVSSGSQPITKYHDWNPYYWCMISNVNKVSYKTCLRQG